MIEMTFKKLFQIRLETSMEKNLQIKDKIIEATKSLLKRQGSFTIKEIAQSCYINIAAVNYHFGSKENLLGIVLKKIITEIKGLIWQTLDQLPDESSVEKTMETILDLIYTYALENIGIIRYLFLQNEYQDDNTQILIREFFSDSPFTKDIYAKIALSTHTEDPETLKVKYMLLFSSFAIPLLIQIQSNPETEPAFLKNPGFRKKYVKELLKILYE